MHSFIVKITHSLTAKDSIAVARGLYKVFQSGISVSRINSANKNSENTWTNKPIDRKAQLRQQNASQSQINSVFELNQDKSPRNASLSSTQTIQQPDKQNQKSILKNSESKTKCQNSFSNPLKINKNYQDILREIDYKAIKPHIKNQVQSKVPSSRLSRFLQFTKLGLNIAESTLELYIKKNDSNGQNQAYEKIAEKITDELCKMRGAPLKLAQMLSIQEDKLIPTSIRKAFQKARQKAHILPPQQVVYMLQKNFGSQWRNKFEQFQEKPFASASIGQVHLATLPSKEQIAIKVQYPGVRTSIESDISNLHLLMKIPGVFPKGMYIEKILKNTKLELMHECDYLLEKQKQRAYDQCLALCLKKQSSLYKVPHVFNQLTTEEIFTSEYLTGVSMKELQESNFSQQIKDEVGRRIMEITFNELFQMGIVQSDPNPSNFSYDLKNDKLNLFDFGATHIYKGSFLKSYYQIIKGSVTQDRQKIFRASVDTQFLTGEQSSVMIQSHIESILVTGEPLRYKGSFDFGNQKITQKIYKTIPVMLKNRLKAPPEEIYSLHRKLSGSYLACMRLKARVDCSKIWQKIKFQRLIEQIDLEKDSKLLV